MISYGTVLDSKQRGDCRRALYHGYEEYDDHLKGQFLYVLQWVESLLFLEDLLQLECGFWRAAVLRSGQGFEFLHWK